MSRFALPLLIALSLAGCRCYQFGAHTLHRRDIRTVYVPMFESDSYRRHLAERLYEAVVKEIEDRTPYKVVSQPRADSTLTVRLTHDSKRVVVSSPTDEARQVEVTLVAQASWTDHRGLVLGESGPFPLDAPTASVERSATFLPEGGQSLATAQQRALVAVARQIVNLMEAPW